MNATQTEILRHALLTGAEAGKPYGMTVELFAMAARSMGLRSVTAAEIEAEIAYLVDKGFLHLEPKALSPENRRWRISATGRDYLATEGLA